jgi:hypothetical protein
MPLAENIQSLGGRSLNALDAAHDHYYHTKTLWRLFQVVVTREKRKVTVRNSTTGNTFSEHDLVALAQAYTTERLPSAALQQCVAVFESVLTDLMRLWLISFPDSLRGKQLEFSAVLDSTDKAALIQSVVDKTVNDLAYKSVADWFAYLESRVRLGCPTKDEIERIAEIKASRDVLVHAQGIVNSIYIEKAGRQARFAVGQRLMVPEHYLNDAFLLIRKIIGDLARAAADKVSPPSPENRDSHQ